MASGCSPTLTVTNGVGRRTAMCDAGGWQAWAYDSRGHVVTERRNTNSVTKSTSYTYNFHGDVTSITYPSGRTVTYTYNAAGQANSAIDVTNSITYASNAHYAAPGHLSSLQESGSNIIFTAYYNNRLQPCRISVKSSGTAPTSCTDSAHVGNVLDFTYSFTNGSANNGNVVSITNNINTARSESFTYDELNRISTAQTTATTGTYAWGLSFGYDAWANLLSASVTQGSAYTLSITATGKNQISGLSYDSAGNMTYDGTNSFTFNGEGELASAAGVVYTYDGDGSRVQKATSGTPPTPYKLYWYGVGSDPLSESDAGGNISTEYIFLGGQRIALLNLSTSAVSYYVQDHLGSSRVVTDASGTVLDDSDFYPYGGERSYLTSSGNHYKFTGKERDSESGLDDFAARFYTSQYGRFLSADDSKYMHPADPQTFNLYSYVANNPINAVDPTGHSPQDPGKYKPYEHGTSPGEEFGVGAGVDSGQTNSGSHTKIYVYLVAEANGVPSFEFVPVTTSDDVSSAVMGGPSDDQSTDNGAPANQTAQNQNQGAGQSSGTATFNLSGATVAFSWATYTEPQGRGVEIEATVKGCDSCVWAQTVSGPDIKGGVEADIQPGADPQKYPFTGGGTHPNDLYDRPERSSAPASLNFVSTMGVPAGKTLNVKGSLTWGFSVNKSGEVRFSGVRVSKPAEQRGSLAIWRKATGMETSP